MSLKSPELVAESTEAGLDLVADADAAASASLLERALYESTRVLHSAAHTLEVMIVEDAGSV